MTDADDAGLVELTDRLREPVFEYVQGFGFALINEIARPDMCKAADLLESQRREIKELRRERDESYRRHAITEREACTSAAKIGEALKVIKPLIEWAKSGHRAPGHVITAASAFAAKHGGRE